MHTQQKEAYESILQAADEAEHKPGLTPLRGQPCRGVLNSLFVFKSDDSVTPPPPPPPPCDN